MFDYQAPESLLADRYIVVTGAGDGIGKAAAIAYAKHGATVILLGRTTENSNKFMMKLRTQAAPNQPLSRSI